mmetsp:Transcript_66682/g.184625  ORF Transcript_66682/g.184625 Transcript_66682/m.184625 type:complete len:324 (-) Transcript_66682:70-1041(-)
MMWKRSKVARKAATNSCAETLPRQSAWVLTPSAVHTSICHVRSASSFGITFSRPMRRKRSASGSHHSSPSPTSWRKRACAFASISSNLPSTCMRNVVVELSSSFSAAALTPAGRVGMVLPFVAARPLLPREGAESSWMLKLAGGSSPVVRLRFSCHEGCRRSTAVPCAAVRAPPASCEQKAVRSISAVRRSKTWGSSMSGISGVLGRRCKPHAFEGSDAADWVESHSISKTPRGKSANRSQAARSKAFVSTSASKRVLSLLVRKANSRSFRRPLVSRSSSKATQGRERSLLVQFALLHQEKLTPHAQRMEQQARSSCRRMPLR